jgi:hypothetical protein
MSGRKGKRQRTDWKGVIQSAALKTVRLAVDEGRWYERRNKTVTVYQLSRELRRALHRLTADQFEVFCSEAEALGRPCELFPGTARFEAKIAAYSQVPVFGWRASDSNFGLTNSGLANLLPKIPRFSMAVREIPWIAQLMSAEFRERIHLLKAFAVKAGGPAGGDLPVDVVAEAYDAAARKFAKTLRG